MRRIAMQMLSMNSTISCCSYIIVFSELSGAPPEENGLSEFSLYSGGLLGTLCIALREPRERCQQNVKIKSMYLH